MQTSTKEWIEILFGFVQTAAIIIGGLYALYEYRRFRRYQPKIEFDVDFEMYPIPDLPEACLVDINLTVKNWGQVRNYFPTINVGVKALQPGDANAALESRKRLRFGKELIEMHNIVHNPKDPWLVDAGVTQAFCYPVVINAPANFIQVNAEFKYYRDREGKTEEAYHQATRVRPVRPRSPE